LVFEPGYQRRLVELAKHKLKEGWKEVAGKLGVSEYTLRVDWRHERSTLPLKHAMELAKIASVDPNDLMSNITMTLPKNWGQKRASAKKANNLKKINTPSLDDPRLTEFVGAFLGDGHLSKYAIEFSGNAKLDRNYLTYFIPKLASDLFDMRGTIRVQRNTARLIFYSKRLSEWFTQTFGFRPGRKVDSRARIPERFFSGVSQLSGCVRGCIDTDGGIHKYYDHLVVAFFNENRMLLDDVARGFNQLGFTPSFTKGREVWILGRKDALSYMSEVGTSNVKNVFRIIEWQKRGRFPRFSEIGNTLDKEINVELPYTINGPVV